MEIERADYCFMDKVYTDADGNSCLFEIVAADAEFLDATTYRMTLGELQRVAEQLPPSVCVDFCFEDGFLKCNARLKRVPMNNVVLQEKKISCRSGVGSLYRLLNMGVKKEFLLLDDFVVQDGFTGVGICEFRQIRFSKSTMSVFVQLCNDEGCYVKKLVAMENGNFVFHPFYFAAPANVSDTLPDDAFRCCTFIKQMTVGAEEYNVWLAKSFTSYELDVLRSESLVNKAMCLREYNSTALSVLKRYLNSLYRSLGTETSPVKWLSDSKPSESFYGVRLKSSIVPLSKKEQDALITQCLDWFSEYKTREEALQALRAQKNTKVYQYAAYALLLVVYQAQGNALDAVQAIVELQSALAENLFYADMYLYRVRGNSYVTHRHVVQADAPYVVGGGEVDFTVVEEGYFYDT